ncbi:hypothetical protein FY528_04800 [Hymenobacter lutimineralis]|uniref:Uncharacterized protein n=1 Tax=Hymenobacter lutimineralis TaxID=2606448 RepID=A0A5D6VCK1_9BACT|nr:hypothetical protein [Hymenobacter lutimineralis]TYZ12619.1 hypothetical protein FY528_04800 [Hymenobacter lutimineralis]
MATTRKPRLSTTVTDAQLIPETDLSGEIPEADLPEDSDAEATLCPTCGDLLAWHEEACDASPSATQQAPPVHRKLDTFAYDLGQPVQPATQAQPHTVVWRGQLKERSPETGWVQRVNVYRLNDGFWDCYREEELQVA